MAFDSWRELYQHDLQGVYALLVGPLLFLLYRARRPAPRAGAVPAAARFVDGYAILFACATILDPIATVLLVRALGITEGPGGTAVLLVFVLLGDFRVFLLIFGLTALAAGRSWRGELGRAAAWTLIVPVAAYAIHNGLQALAGWLSPNAIWLVYELCFLAMALLLRARWVPQHVPVAARGLRAYLRAVTTYVAVYYALWAAADVLIQLVGLDVGWALRVLPNQLYYGLWIPVVFFTFFAPRYHSTSVSTHAPR